MIWISFNSSLIELVILSEVSWSLTRASLICADEACVSVLNARICSATTAKPRPASPALAASIEALRASKLVWLEILSIVPVSFLTVSNSDLNSVRIFSTSIESSDIELAVVTRLWRSTELSVAWFNDSVVNVTMLLISETTFCTCELISVVISIDEDVWDCNWGLLSISKFISSTTSSEPCLFSAASSRTTVIPSIIVLLAVFTCATVWVTLFRSAFMLAVNAPSDSVRCLIEST